MQRQDSERVSSGRGSGTSDIGYTTRKIIATVVSSDHVNDIVQRMKKALDGDKAVVMISAVDDLVMI
jgi:hypothetical protein